VFDAVTFDFSRTMILGRKHAQCAEFAAVLEANGQLAGCVWESPPRAAALRLWRRRVTRHGWLPTASRAAALVADRALYRIDRANRATDPAPARDRSALAAPRHLTVSDINSPEVAELIGALEPTLCIVVGASIIREPVLSTLSKSLVVNLHAGKTPKYRGTHGGVWAVIRSAPEDVVTTIHLLDAGIDTGRPLVYVPVSVKPTMTAMAAEHRRSALRWLAESATKGKQSVDPVHAPPRGELLYPPRLSEWRTFRRRSLSKADEIRNQIPGRIS